MSDELDEVSEKELLLEIHRQLTTIRRYVAPIAFLAWLSLIGGVIWLIALFAGA